MAAATAGEGSLAAGEGSLTAGEGSLVAGCACHRSHRQRALAAVGRGLQAVVGTEPRVAEGGVVQAVRETLVMAAEQ